MRESRLFGSEGGAKLSFVPTPIRALRTNLARLNLLPVNGDRGQKVYRPL